MAYWANHRSAERLNNRTWEIGVRSVWSHLSAFTIRNKYIVKNLPKVVKWKSVPIDINWHPKPVKKSGSLYPRYFACKLMSPWRAITINRMRARIAVTHSELAGCILAGLCSIHAYKSIDRQKRCIFHIIWESDSDEVVHTATTLYTTYSSAVTGRALDVLRLNGGQHAENFVIGQRQLSCIIRRSQESQESSRFKSNCRSPKILCLLWAMWPVEHSISRSSFVFLSYHYSISWLQ